MISSLDKIRTFFIILFFIVLFFGLGYNVYHDTTTIDTRVETIDGKVYNCTQARAHDNGMTYIGNPYNVQIPTINVKEIKRIK